MPPVDAPVHPAAEVFPPLSQGEYAELRDDIATHGVLEAIFVDEKGRVLDGRHRLRAAHETGKPCPTLMFDGADPIGFVASKNLHRRHMTAGQRAMAASKLADLKMGRPSAKTGSRDPVSIATAAKLMQVSAASVKRAKVVHLHGDTALVRAVEDGTVPLKRAAAMARPPKTAVMPEATRSTETARMPSPPSTTSPEIATPIPSTAEVEVAPTGTTEQPVESVIAGYRTDMFAAIKVFARFARTVSPRAVQLSCRPDRRATLVGQLRAIILWASDLRRLLDVDPDDEAADDAAVNTTDQLNAATSGARDTGPAHKEGATS